MWIVKLLGYIVLAAVLAVGGLAGSMWIEHSQATTLPSASGEYPVGRTSYVWRDPTQSDLLAPKPGTVRTLLAWLWYPAARTNGTEKSAVYLPKPWRRARAQMSGPLMTDVLTRDLSRVRTHTIANAALSAKRPTYPVIIMRAGLAALTTDYTTLAEDLASHGYVVVGFDAPYLSQVVVFPDGHVIRRAPQNDADLVSGHAQKVLATKLVSAWSVYMSFALDQLQRLDSTHPAGRFTGRLDLSRVGVFGHSLGGATALQFCHLDSRCKAGIDIDGAPLGTVIREGVTQPFMFLMSDHRSNAESREVDANIRSIYARLPSGRRLQLMIRGANHFDFSDNAVLKSHIMMALLRAFGIVRLSGHRQLFVTTQCVHRFFDVYLKGAPHSILEGCTGLPEIEPLSESTSKSQTPK